MKKSNLVDAEVLTSSHNRLRRASLSLSYQLLSRLSAQEFASQVYTVLFESPDLSSNIISLL
jgi:hypothetical protein